MNDTQKFLWGGRFVGKPDELAIRFSSSLATDIRLIEEDIEGSIAHVQMLAHVKLLSDTEALTLMDGLRKILSEWQDGSWQPDPASCEDVHSAVEVRLTELIGPVAGKLHTGRSRNDQVATDERLWLRKACARLKTNLRDFQHALLEVAEKHIDTLMPGYTHLQRAQPVSLAYHLLAYVEMAGRDIERLLFVERTLSECPLGSGALAGSTLPLDRDITARTLHFESPAAHALDAVSNRDYFLDFLNSCVLGMMHLSRLAEELILWSTKEWKFVTLSDAWTTGSSLMPQKKNPDLAELIRGRAGRVYGNYLALATTLKALPLSYNRDMQEDKHAVFDSCDTYEGSLVIMARMITSLTVHADRFREDMKSDFSEATDVVDRLVLKGIPFRQAHETVGRLVHYCESMGKILSELSLEEFQRFLSAWTTSDSSWLKTTPLERKKTLGSPHPNLVRQQIERWKLTLFRDNK